MALTIAQALQQGITAHKEGRLQDAERFYRAILQSHPGHPDANHNLGVLAVSIDKAEAALPLLKTALEANPKIEQFWLSYIDALIRERQFDNVEQVLEQAKKQGVSADKLNSLETRLSPNTQKPAVGINPPQELLDSLTGHYQNGRFAEAEKLSLSITKDYPKHPFGWKALGVVLGAIGRKSEAVAANQEAIALSPQDPEAHNNLGNTLRELGRLEEAAASFNQAIALNPKFSQALYNAGITLQELGRLEEAKASYNQSIALKPDFAEAHNNLGVTLKRLGRFEEAEVSYHKAIAFKPNQVDAYNNLGNTLQELGKLEEAEASYNQLIALKPDFAEAHSNLGNARQELGRLEEAKDSFHRAIVLKPDYTEAYNNYGKWLAELGRLNAAMNIYHMMLTTKSECVSNALVSPVVALLPFGRAGSMFFHSLFDGHPEIATLPGVYFKGWFGIDQWRRFAPDTSKLDWRESLIAKVVKEYQPLFNANCKNNVAGKPFGNSKWLAKHQGFTNMGPDRSQKFVVDQKSFSDTFLSLLEPFSSIGIQECFELIHRAFDIAARRNMGAGSQKNGNIFYHIHNPSPYEYAHFLKHYPKARLLHIIRNPLQSMESWMLSMSFPDMDDTSEKIKSDEKRVRQVYIWTRMIKVVETMFAQLQSPFNTQAQSRGVRLEDIKRNANVVMPKIAAWIGVSDHPAIYESSFCGLQYWGPSSKRIGKITGFDTKAIDLPTGRLLGSRDISIFETLFWPLSRQYRYTKLGTAEFRRKLAEIRPWLAEPLEFERRLYDELFDHSRALEELTPYIRLHDLLSRLWETLYQDGTYCNMVKPLELAD